VHVAQSVLSLDLEMPYCISLLAVPFGTICPAKLGKKRKIFVIDESKLILGQWNLTHRSETSV